MIKKTVTIENHEWVIGLNRDRELHFSFQEVVRDEWAGLFCENMIQRHLPRLKGRWECQVIEKTWFYFNKIK